MDTAVGPSTIYDQESTLKTEKEVQSISKEAGDLFTWTSPARPFKRRNKEYYITLVAFAAIVGLVLFVAEGAMPVILLVSLIFLYYVMNTVEPGLIEHKITSEGVKVDAKLTPWEEMVRFWFSHRFDNELLIIQIHRLPGKMEMVVSPESKESIRNILKKKIPEETQSPSSLDRVANWFSKRLPEQQ